MRAVLRILFLLIALCAPAMAKNSEISLVVIDYFFEPGCPDCLHVKQQVMPELEERFEGFCKVNRYNVNEEANVLILARYQDALKITKNEPVCMVVDYQYVFNGFKKIKKDMFGRIDESVALRMAPGWVQPKPIVRPGEEGMDVSILRQRMSQWTIPGLMIAGLGDGVNPCAIGTLVFFLSLLAVSRVRGRALILMGVSFCVASFVTYTAIGFALLRALYLLDSFDYARQGFGIVMAGILAVLAILSFRDAYRYRIERDAAAVTLQLPASIKMLTHRIMKAGLGMGNLILAGLMIGTAVTALESICTGQLYIPVLVSIIKLVPNDMTAWKYLLLYNGMFIVPLVVVFVAVSQGLKTERLLNWSKCNVVLSKVILGLFFVGLAVLIAYLER